MGADQVMTQIDLSQYKIGQRFRTRGGKVVTLVKVDRISYWSYRFKLDDTYRSFSVMKDGACYLGGDHSDLDIIRPICRRPARTRRLPKPSPMPTGYEKQWPHLYQMGGGA